MTMKNKLTVAEYAQKHKISVQAVYKKLDKLEVIEEEKNGKTIKFILEDEEQETTEDIKPSSTSSTPDIKPSSTAENGDIKPSSTPDIKPPSTEDIKPSSTAENPYVDYIKLLKSQIEEKDKQIERLQHTMEEKDKQAKEQFDRLTELIKRSQDLEAYSHRLLEEGKTAEAEEDSNIEVIEEEQTEKSQEQTKKKGFFSRLFKRKGES